MPIQAGSKLVAIIDDDESVRTALVGLMQASGLSARGFATAEEFFGCGELPSIGCLILDICMPAMSGLDLLAKLKSEQCNISVISVTAHGDADLRTKALQAGAVAFLSKPFNDDALLETVRATLEM